MIYPQACWRVHITCPRCGEPVTPVALGADRPLQLDTRAIVECAPCGGERWIVELTMQSEKAARRADRQIDSAIAREAETVARAQWRQSA